MDGPLVFVYKKAPQQIFAAVLTVVFPKKSEETSQPPVLIGLNFGNQLRRDFRHGGCAFKGNVSHGSIRLGKVSEIISSCQGACLVIIINGMTFVDG